MCKQVGVVQLIDDQFQHKKYYLWRPEITARGAREYWSGGKVDAYSPEVWQSDTAQSILPSKKFEPAINAEHGLEGRVDLSHQNESN